MLKTMSITTKDTIAIVKRSKEKVGQSTTRTAIAQPKTHGETEAKFNPKQKQNRKERPSIT